MNNLEHDSQKEVDVLMEASTYGEMVEDSGWSSPVKHVDKLNRHQSWK